VNAQSRTERLWFTTQILKNVDAQATCHFGTVNIALPVQLELNLIPRKNNAITVLKDSKETSLITLVSQDFEVESNDKFIIVLFKICALSPEITLNLEINF